MNPPEGILGENLQSNCDGVKVLLVDERSLIGATTLGWMEFMCRYGMPNGENFEKSLGEGDFCSCFFGDDVHLPPVLDSPVFNSTSKIPASLHGVLVWNEFNCAVNLQNIVRQGNNEQQLKNVLLALREYKTTSEHAHWLQMFQWHNLKQSHGESLLKRMSANGLFVFPTHQEVWTHNKSQFPIARVNAVSSGFHSKSSESDRAGGLQQTLYLCKSAKVMLSVNLCVPFGLFNGAIGNIVDIIYLNDKRPDDSLPDAVMVEFHSYTGPAFIEQNPKLVPIVPVERKLDCSCNCCRRKQIPLRLGWASTIHRCQGMTIGKGEPNSYIVINPGTRAFESRTPGALFVALSRAKSAGNDKLDPDFAWHPSVLVNEDRLCHVVTTPTVKARNNEIERISRLCIQTKNKYASLENDQGLLHFIEQSLNFTPEE
ncbi:PIF1 [Mytilus edulis]|uniref:PIF1 n=1 Tax=Mytilus edulis TaxID=6550 RepID=A0A8S3PSJ6_MYTED|nr:PIF1 [Mytilus edulis]